MNTMTSRFGRLVGISQAMEALFETLELAAPSRAPVVLIGESGTGKELAARALHEKSPRYDQIFEVVDCAALSEPLLDAELFGRAVDATVRLGALERAHRGTLFLDRPAELPLTLQAKLLRVLDGHGGGTDLRVISATDRDPRREVASGKMRADFYYRLAVIQARIPPLRQRLEDLSLLLAELTSEIDPRGDPPSWDLERLRKHTWPGNVRELRNYVEEQLILGVDPSRERVARATQICDARSSPPRDRRFSGKKRDPGSAPDICT